MELALTLLAAMALGAFFGWLCTKNDDDFGGMA